MRGMGSWHIVFESCHTHSHTLPLHPHCGSNQKRLPPGHIQSIYLPSHCSWHLGWRFLFFICQWLIQITTWCPLGCSTAQLPAHHFHVFHVPAVVTHSAPLAIPFHFHPPFTAMGTSHQSHFGRRLCKEMRYWLEIRSGPESMYAVFWNSSTTFRMWKTEGWESGSQKGRQGRGAPGLHLWVLVLLHSCIIIIIIIITI